MNAVEQLSYDAFLKALPHDHTWSVELKKVGLQHRLEAYTHTDPNRKYVAWGRSVQHACAKCIRQIRGIGIPA